MPEKRMETLNQIGQNLGRGISVFYEVIYLCTYSMGYIPGEKQLPQEASELLDELHEERRLGSMWIVQDAMGIRDHMVPMLKKVCGEFEEAYRLAKDGEKLTRENAKLCFQNLAKVIAKFSDESKRLENWMRQIEKLRSEVQAKEKPLLPGEEGYYSWKDAAEKLGRVWEEAGKMDISWAGMSRLAVDTLKELDKAESSPSRVLQEVFLQAAAKQWADIVKIAQNITDIMQNK